MNSFRRKFTCVSDILIKEQVDYFAISDMKQYSSFSKSQFGFGDYVF